MSPRIWFGNERNDCVCECLFVCLFAISLRAPGSPGAILPLAMGCTSFDSLLSIGVAFLANELLESFMVSEFWRNLMAHSCHTPLRPQEFKFVLLEHEIGFLF